MFGGTFDPDLSMPALFACVCAVGIAVKLMDDFIDRRLDAVGGVTTWASVVGDGVLPYAMFTLAVAMLISGRLAGTLFLAAYALGMAHDLRRKLPSGLEGWHESVLALSLGALLGGVGRMVASLAVLTFVQCVDDVVDDDADRVRGSRSLVALIGRTETMLLAVVALVVAASLAPRMTTAALVATAVVLHAADWLAMRYAPWGQAR